MADNNKLELVVEVGVNKANASIKSINTGLSSMEQAAGKAARGASAGIDGFTVSMVKGATAGNLLFKGKLKPDDVKKMGYTDDQVREIISGKKLLPGESWGDFSGAGFPKIKILGKGELSDDEVNRIATERKKRGEAEKSAQELYMRAVEERKIAEHEQFPELYSQPSPPGQLAQCLVRAWLVVFQGQNAFVDGVQEPAGLGGEEGLQLRGGRGP